MLNGADVATVGGILLLCGRVEIENGGLAEHIKVPCDIVALLGKLGCLSGNLHAIGLQVEQPDKTAYVYLKILVLLLVWKF